MLTRAGRVLRSGVTLGCLALGFLLSVSIGHRVTAQTGNPLICGDPPCYNPPPTITINNVPSFTTTASMTPYVSLCYPGYGIAAESVFVRGTYQSGWTWGNGGVSCPDTSSHAVSLVLGNNTFSVIACSSSGGGNMGECGDDGTNTYYDNVQVTPHVTTFADAGVSYDTSFVFTITNYQSTSGTFNLTTTCSGSGVTACTNKKGTSVTIGGNSSVQDTVTFTTGSTAGSTGKVQVKAVYATNSAGVDSGYVNITAQWPPQLAIVSTAYTNQADQNYSRCANTCFAATTSLSTVPYISQDVARSVTLIYNADRVNPRPIVMADVALEGTLYTATDLMLWVTINGSYMPFANGQDTLHFKPSALQSHMGTSYRIGGELLANSLGGGWGWAVGNYPMKIIVTAVYSDNNGSYNEQMVDSTHRFVSNREGGLSFPYGWTPADWSKLYWSSDGTWGDWASIVDGDGSAHLYGPEYCGGSWCTYAPAAGEFDTLYAVNAYGDSLYERRFLDGSKWVYSTNTGYQVEYKIDRLGDTTRFAYNSVFDLDTIFDPYRSYNGKRTGTVLSYSGPGGMLSAIQEPAPYPTNTPGLGRLTTITVASSDSTLTKWSDPDTISTQFTYDGAHRLLDIIDRGRDTTKFAYATDSSWKLAQIIAPKVPIDSASTGSPVTESPTTTYQAWQVSGVPHTITSATSQATPVQTSTIVASVTDAAHHTSTYTPDSWGQALIAVDPLGDTTTITRDANGFPALIKYPTGGHEQFSYSDGLLQWHVPTGGDTVYYSYGTYNQVSQVRSRHAPTNTADLDFAGPGGALPYKTWINTDSAHATYLYWQQIRTNGGPWMGLDSTVDAAGHKMQSTYDTTTGNRATTKGEYSDQRDSIRFDGYGRDSLIFVGASPPDTILYDLMNRPISQADGVHAPTVTRYGAIFVDTIIDPKGQKYSFQHNALGWETSRTDPANNTTYETYTQIGLPATLKNRRGQLLAYRYDALGRLLAKHDPGAVDSATYSYTIATNNQQRVASNALETDTYYADSTGWTDSVKTYIGATNKTYTQHYKHTDQFQLDSVWLSGSALTFTWANLRMRWDTLTGLLDSTFVNGNGIRAHYDVEYVRDSLTYPSSVVAVDSVGSMDSHQRTARHFMNTSGSVLTSLDTAFYRAYSYDSAGRIIEEDRHNAIATYGQQFAYDATGELTSWWLDSASAGWHCLPNKNCYKDSGAVYTAADTMFYDAAGNIDSSAATPNTSDSTIGAIYRTANRDSTWRATGDTLRYWYDLDGERDSLHGPGGAKYYTWAADGRLLSVKTGTRTVSYAYNADGLLMQRSINGVVDRYFVWDRGNLRAEIDSTGANRINEYVEISGTDQPLARIIGSSSTVHYYTQDAVGNVLGHFSGSTLEENLRYDPWGKLIAAGSTLNDTTRLRWKGLYWEADSTRMYYDRGRWYDPEQRRFASEDPLGVAAGINDYVYASGDPVNGSDPSGLVECSGDASEDDTCDNGGGGGFGDDEGWGGDDGGWDYVDGPPPTMPTVYTTGYNPNVCTSAAACQASMALMANLANIQATDDAIAQGQVAFPNIGPGGYVRPPSQAGVGYGSKNNLWYLTCVLVALCGPPTKPPGPPDQGLPPIMDATSEEYQRPQDPFGPPEPKWPGLPSEVAGGTQTFTTVATVGTLSLLLRYVAAALLVP